MTYVLLLVIIALCCLIVYAHHKHADVLEEIRATLARLRKKIDGN